MIGVQILVDLWTLHLNDNDSSCVHVLIKVCFLDTHRVHCNTVKPPLSKGGGGWD